jgi:hypothetical protein
MIPTEAARAAVKAAKESFGGEAPRGMRAAIRAALEAAAPHIKAQAIEKAADDAEGLGMEEIPVHSLRHRANCYREYGHS